MCCGIVVAVSIVAVSVNAQVGSDGVPQAPPADDAISLAPESPVVAPAPQARYTAENAPYEFGTILVQYDSDTFNAHTGVGNTGGAGVPGGLLRGTRGSARPVAAVNEFLTDEGITARVTDTFPDLQVEVIDIGDDVDPLPLLKYLGSVPGVVFAQPNILYDLTAATPSTTGPDPSLNTQWHLDVTRVTNTTPRVSSSTSSTAWAEVAAQTGLTYLPKVGIVDTGLQVQHPEFSGKTASASCKLPRFLAASPLIPLARKTENPLLAPLTATCTHGGYDFVGNDADVNHDYTTYTGLDAATKNFHGSAVAGIIAAKSNNATDGAGIAQSVRLLPLRVGLNASGKQDTIGLLKAIAFARINEVDILNMSFGHMHYGTCYVISYNFLVYKADGTLEHQQLKKFGTPRTVGTRAVAGGLTVTGAGNGGYRIGAGRYFTSIPADFSTNGTRIDDNNVSHSCWTALPNIISVAATKMDGTKEKLADFSNYGPHISIAAPGANIPVLSPPSNTAATTSHTTSAGMTTADGTSYAASMVTATLALMKRVKPTLTPAQLKSKLLASADEVLALAGPDCTPGTSDDLVKGARRLNAYNAVRAALNTTTTPVTGTRLTAAQKTACRATMTPALSTPAGGRDNDGDGLIEIYTAEELLNVRHSVGTKGYRAGKNGTVVTTGCPTVEGTVKCSGFELMRDIDLDSMVWHPIGTASKRFTGVFDGNNYTISNLEMRGISDYSYRGFFGYTSNATIRNIKLQNAIITGGDPNGLLIGYMQGGSVTNVSAYGPKSLSDGWDTGGLIGYTRKHNSTVTRVAVEAMVRGKRSAGGLIGRAWGTSITDGFVTGTVDGPEQSAGGVVGALIHSQSKRKSRNTLSGVYSNVVVNGGTGAGIHGTKNSVVINAAFGTTPSYYNHDIARGGFFRSVSESPQLSRGRTAKQLRGSPGATVFTGWSTDMWDFGTTTQLPIMKNKGLTRLTNHPSDPDGDGLLNIATVADLQALQGKIGTECPSTVCSGFELTANIDLSTVKDFTPIGTKEVPFGLVFDGNNHTISNLTVKVTQDDSYRGGGLFGYTSEAVHIKNLTLSNPRVSGSENLGSLVGYMKGGTVTDVTVTGATVKGGVSVGGMVGYATRTVFSEVAVDAMVTGNSRVGGLIGYTNATLPPGGNRIKGPTISKAAVNATVSGGWHSIGGMLGVAENVSVTDSYVTGSVTPTRHHHSYSGGMFGRVSYTQNTVTNSYSSVAVGAPGLETTSVVFHSRGSGNGLHGHVYSKLFKLKMVNSYWNKDVARNTHPKQLDGNNSGRTLKQLLEGTPSTVGTTAFVGWSTDTWDFGTATQLPMLKNMGLTRPAMHADDADGDGLIDIDSTADLAAVQAKLGTVCPSTTCNGFELTADLDMTGVTHTPIGTLAEPFGFVFDGNNHTISNLTINTPTKDAVGLFGQVNRRADISDFTLSNVSITGGNKVGAVAGQVLGVIGSELTKIYDVTVSGGTVSGAGTVGGVVGTSQVVEIKDVTVSGLTVSKTTTGTGKFIGGVVGRPFGGTKVINSVVGVTVSGTRYVGGVFGSGTSSEDGVADMDGSGTITGTTVTATVSGNNAGGFTGQARGMDITDSDVTGSVNGTNSGGMIGLLTGRNAVVRSYSNVSVNAGIGNGLYGALNTATLSGGVKHHINVTNSYYNKDIASAAEQNSAGRTAAQMQARTFSDTTYTDWDTNDWEFIAGSNFPVFQGRR